MVTINLICVGNIKEKYFTDAFAEYAKRLTKFCKLNVTEVAEHKLTGKATDGNILQVKEKEGEKILQKISGQVVLLDVLGKQLSSPQLADKLESFAMTNSTISFVIGGSYGVSDAVKSKADFLLSFSPMTFPHQLMRVVLAEQLYRAFTINNNILYHK